MTAEELLMSDEVEVFQYSNVIEIDGQSRHVNVPIGEDMFGVEGDKNATLKHFTCPKIVGNNIEIDLSEHNLYANYTLADEKGNPKSEDVIQSPCENIVIGDDNITFDWKISEWVTKEDGYIAFSIVAKKSVDGVVETRWYTTPAVGKVLKTVKEGRHIEQQYPDVIDNLMNRVSDLERILANGGGTGGSVVVDEALSETSTNPVQNKVVTKEIRQLYEEIDDLTNDIGLYPLKWEQGGIKVSDGSGGDANITTGIRTNFIRVRSSSLCLSGEDVEHFKHRLIQYDINKTFIRSIGYNNDAKYTLNPETAYIRFAVKNQDESLEVTPNEKTTWFKCYDGDFYIPDEVKKSIRIYGILPDGTNLDDILYTSVYYGSSSYNYENFPTDKASTVITIKYDERCTQIVLDGYGRVCMRKRTQALNWTEWSDNQKIMQPKTILFDMQPTVEQLSNIDNSIRLKVGTYNVAKYCMETASGGKFTYLYNLPDKVLNIRKFIARSDLDILCLQEAKSYFDDDQTKSAWQYLFGHWLLRAFSSTERICARIGDVGNNYGREEYPILDGTGYTNHRYFSWAKLQLTNGKILLVISTHNRNTYIEHSDLNNPGPVANRAYEYKYLFEYIRNQFNSDDLPWDYCIVGGDFNTSNYDGIDESGEYIKVDNVDFENLKNICKHYNFSMANGGDFGWFVTHPNLNCALDNIIVSSNIMINNVECDTELYEHLYSDHLPVVATVDLLDEVAVLPSTEYELTN